MRNAVAKGYTLLEAMIVMTVICLLAGIGLPAFRELLANQRLTAATHQLSAHFALARSSAISSGVPVSACPSSGDGSCRSDSDWSQGWLVFRDPERQGQPIAPDSIVSEGRAPGDGALVLRSNRGRPSIRFLPDGRSAGSNLTVNICERGQLREMVVVNNSGRIRTRRTTGSLPCRSPD